MNDVTTPSPLFSLIPLLFIGFVIAIPAYLLAKEKGRNPLKWVILGLIPVVNWICIWYFVGTPSTRLENKIDALLKAQGEKTDP